MQRTIAAGEGSRVITLICRELAALRRFVEAKGCFSNNDTRHLRSTIEALNAVDAK